MAAIAFNWQYWPPKGVTGLADLQASTLKTASWTGPVFDLGAESDSCTFQLDMPTFTGPGTTHDVVVEGSLDQSSWVQLLDFGVQTGIVAGLRKTVILSSMPYRWIRARGIVTGAGHQAQVWVRFAFAQPLANLNYADGRRD